MLTKKVIAVSVGIIMFVIHAEAKQKHVLSKQNIEFIRSFTPHIAAANMEIYQDRNTLLAISEYFNRTGYITIENRTWLAKLAEDYEVEWNLENGTFNDVVSSVMDELIQRVDVVPLKLVLAQAIIESGWGRSKAAQLTHNYFGVTCRCINGSVVTESAQQTYYLREYTSKTEGIKHYLRILNTKQSYRAFREIRAQYRENAWPLTALNLSKGLMNYSELKSAYITKINYLIRKYLKSEFHSFIIG